MFRKQWQIKNRLSEIMSCALLLECIKLSGKTEKTGTGTSFENSIPVIAFIKFKNKQL